MVRIVFQRAWPNGLDEPLHHGIAPVQMPLRLAKN
jgi:hypothetical protein